MSRYVCHYARKVNKMDYICHYGVKGMKWGVRKEEYKSMSRSDRKALRQKKKQQYKSMRNQEQAFRTRAENSYDSRTAGSYHKAKANYQRSEQTRQLINKRYEENPTFLRSWAKASQNRSTKQAKERYQDEAVKRQASVDASVSKNMLKKYGQKRVSEYNQYEAKRGLAVASGVLAGSVGLMVVSSATMKRR